ncbi:MAG: hypothetical protein ABR499_18005 [Gemmatimonadaceae bacterium]
MRKNELEMWLCGGDDDGPTATDMAILGADLASLSPAAVRSIGFVLAALRDIYTDDAAVWRWLRRPRPDLAYARAADLLLAGDTARIEALVTYQWNVAQGGGALHSALGGTFQHASGPHTPAWRS